MTQKELKRFVVACRRYALDEDRGTPGDREEAMELAREALRRFRERA